MKAIVDRTNWKIRLDNEAVKAIRFVRGLNTDLRVSLKGINEMDLWLWLSHNEISIFGMAMMDMHPESTSPDFDKYEKMIDGVVRQIIR